MPDREPPHLLLLGGTTEAAALAHAVADRPWQVIYSLAGRAAPRRVPPGEIRVGGFGGAAGLEAFLRQERVAAVVDATHPFAARISRNARLACEAAACPRLLLRRPAWERLPADRWIEVDGLEAAAAVLPRLGRRVFLTLGTADLAPFAAVPGVSYALRMIEPPPAPPFAGCTVLAARGPFTEADEFALFREHRFDVLVTKASGGAATAAKLAAARVLGLPVVMIRRPPPEPGPAVADAAAALEWLDRMLGGRDNPGP